MDPLQALKGILAYAVEPADTSLHSPGPNKRAITHCGYCIYTRLKRSWQIRYKPFGSTMDGGVLAGNAGTMMVQGRPSVWLGRLCSRVSEDSEEEPPFSLVAEILKRGELRQLLKEARFRLLRQHGWRDRGSPTRVVTVSRKDQTELDLAPLLRFVVNESNPSKNEMLRAIDLAIWCTTRDDILTGPAEDWEVKLSKEGIGDAERCYERDLLYPSVRAFVESCLDKIDDGTKRKKKTAKESNRHTPKRQLQRSRKWRSYEAVHLEEYEEPINTVQVAGAETMESTTKNIIPGLRKSTGRFKGAGASSDSDRDAHAGLNSAEMPPTSLKIPKNVKHCQPLAGYMTPTNRITQLSPSYRIPRRRRDLPSGAKEHGKPSQFFQERPPQKTPIFSGRLVYHTPETRKRALSPISFNPLYYYSHKNEVQSPHGHIISEEKQSPAAPTAIESFESRKRTFESLLSSNSSQAGESRDTPSTRVGDATAEKFANDEFDPAQGHDRKVRMEPKIGDASEDTAEKMKAKHDELVSCEVLLSLNHEKDRRQQNKQFLQEETPHSNLQRTWETCLFPTPNVLTRVQSPEKAHSLCDERQSGNQSANEPSNSEGKQDRVEAVESPASTTSTSRDDIDTVTPSTTVGDETAEKLTNELAPAQKAHQITDTEEQKHIETTRAKHDKLVPSEELLVLNQEKERLEQSEQSSKEEPLSNLLSMSTTAEFHTPEIPKRIPSPKPFKPLHDGLQREDSLAYAHAISEEKQSPPTSTSPESFEFRERTIESLTSTIRNSQTDGDEGTSPTTVGDKTAEEPANNALPPAPEDGHTPNVKETVGHRDGHASENIAKTVQANYDELLTSEVLLSLHRPQHNEEFLQDEALSNPLVGMDKETPSTIVGSKAAENFTKDERAEPKMANMTETVRAKHDELFSSEELLTRDNEKTLYDQLPSTMKEAQKMDFETTTVVGEDVIFDYEASRGIGRRQQMDPGELTEWYNSSDASKEGAVQFPRLALPCPSAYSVAPNEAHQIAPPTQRSEPGEKSKPVGAPHMQGAASSGYFDVNQEKRQEDSGIQQEDCKTTDRQKLLPLNENDPALITAQQLPHEQQVIQGNSKSLDSKELSIEGGPNSNLNADQGSVNDKTEPARAEATSSFIVQDCGDGTQEEEKRSFEDGQMGGTVHKKNENRSQNILAGKAIENPMRQTQRDHGKPSVPNEADTELSSEGIPGVKGSAHPQIDRSDKATIMQRDCAEALNCIQIKPGLRKKVVAVAESKENESSGALQKENIFSEEGGVILSATNINKVFDALAMEHRNESGSKASLATRTSSQSLAVSYSPVSKMMDAPEARPLECWASSEQSSQAPAKPKDEEEPLPRCDEGDRCITGLSQGVRVREKKYEGVSGMHGIHEEQKENEDSGSKLILDETDSLSTGRSDPFRLSETHDGGGFIPPNEVASVGADMNSVPEQGIVSLAGLASSAPLPSNNKEILSANRRDKNANDSAVSRQDTLVDTGGFSDVPHECHESSGPGVERALGDGKPLFKVTDEASDDPNMPSFGDDDDPSSEDDSLFAFNSEGSDCGSLMDPTDMDKSKDIDVSSADEADFPGVESSMDVEAMLNAATSFIMTQLGSQPDTSRRQSTDSAHHDELSEKLTLAGTPSVFENEHMQVIFHSGASLEKDTLVGAEKVPQKKQPVGAVDTVSQDDCLSDGSPSTSLQPHKALKPAPDEETDVKAVSAVQDLTQSQPETAGEQKMDPAQWKAPQKELPPTSRPKRKRKNIVRYNEDMLGVGSVASTLNEEFRSPYPPPRPKTKTRAKRKPSEQQKTPKKKARSTKTLTRSSPPEQRSGKLKEEVNDMAEDLSDSGDAEAPEKIHRNPIAGPNGTHWEPLCHTSIISDYVYGGFPTLEFGTSITSAAAAIDQELAIIANQRQPEDEEYFLETKLYNKTLGQRIRQALAEKTARYRDLVEFRQARRENLQIKKSPEELEEEAFVARKPYFALSTERTANLMCPAGASCWLCGENPDRGSGETKKASNIPAPSYVLSSIKDFWTETDMEEEMVKTSKNANKGPKRPSRRRGRNKSNKLQTMLLEMRHSLRFIADYNDGYLRQPG